jgi:hypothetical protein
MEVVDVLTASGNVGNSNAATCSCGNPNCDPTNNTRIMVGDSTSTGVAYGDYCDLDCVAHVH